MRIQRAELAVYNARAVDLLKGSQEHGVPRGDVDAIAGPQLDCMAALLHYEAESIPFGLEDPPLIVEGSLDECREHRSISRIHAFSLDHLLGFPIQASLRRLSCQCHADDHSCDQHDVKAEF